MKKDFSASHLEMPEALIKKYNVPTPRYTSYPTLPFWSQESMCPEQWRVKVKEAFDLGNTAQGISLYIHLPFCEELCTYCACNKRITKNHRVEKSYIEALLQEWDMYLELFGSAPVIRELHLGGGTPTFFSPESLSALIEGILKDSKSHARPDYSFEGHPNNTTKEHLISLYDLGFRRVSYGVQDLDLQVQKAIHRVQPYQNVAMATECTRQLGYDSVNFDLIYGLPFQTEDSIRSTVEKVIELHPERIAFYSYAHVPWKGKGQRAYSTADLPNDDFKRRLYEIGKQLFLECGYLDVGMDHFALEGDALYLAHQSKTMHRNFMGYTPHKTALLLGLGASSISDAQYAYAQNEKKVETYMGRVGAGQLPLTIGHQLSEEDHALRDIIMDILCSGEACWEDGSVSLEDSALNGLRDMAGEGIVQLSGHHLQVTDKGMPFIRNVCAHFDRYLRPGRTSVQGRFSQAI